jgi:hypothetical protein
MQRFVPLTATVLLTAALVVGCASPVNEETGKNAGTPRSEAPSTLETRPPEPTPGETNTAPQDAVPTHRVGEIHRMPWTAGTLEPPDFERVFEVYDADPARGYPANDSGAMRLLVAHATAEGSSYGRSPGNDWLDWLVGDHVEVFGGTHVIAERWDAPKPEYGTQPPLADTTWQDYRGAVVLVTCRPISPWEGATHNVWTVLRPLEGAP